MGGDKMTLTVKEAQNLYFNRKRIFTATVIKQFGDTKEEDLPARECFILEFPSSRNIELLVVDEDSYAFINRDIDEIFK